MSIWCLVERCANILLLNAAECRVLSSMFQCGCPAGPAACPACPACPSCPSCPAACLAPLAPLVPPASGGKRGQAGEAGRVGQAGRVAKINFPTKASGTSGASGGFQLIFLVGARNVMFRILGWCHTWCCHTLSSNKCCVLHRPWTWHQPKVSLQLMNVRWYCNAIVSCADLGIVFLKCQPGWLVECCGKGWW